MTDPAHAPDTSSMRDEVLAKVQDAARAEGLDAVVATSPENVSYTGGAAPPSMRTVRSRLAACVTDETGTTEMVAVALEAPLMVDESWAETVTAYEEFADDPVEVVARRLRARGLDRGRIGIERDHLTVSEHERLRAALPGAELVGVDALFERSRTVKTPSEIAAIRDIGQAAARIADEAIRLARPGMAEREIANVVTERYMAAGGDGLTMLVVASGPRSAHPNAPPGSRRLEEGDVLRLDVIGTKRRYCSDVARTVVVGRATAEQKHIYALLAGVHEQILTGIRPGASPSRLNRIYRDALEGAGLPAYHFVGHGLGLTLHEEPYVNERTTRPLEEDMVLCVEPLTFLRGRFGMQIEDEIVVRADGCDPITTAPRTLVETGA